MLFGGETHCNVDYSVCVCVCGFSINRRLLGGKHVHLSHRVAKTSRRAKYSESMPFANPFYTSSGFLDDLATAAAFLHLATGSSDYLNQAKCTGNRIHTKGFSRVS